MELVNADVETTPIMVESTSDQFRTTHVFERGNWMVKGEIRNPGRSEHFK